MAAAGDGSGHTPLTPEWTPAPRASHYPWQGDRPAAAPSVVMCRRKSWEKEWRFSHESFEIP